MKTYRTRSLQKVSKGNKHFENGFFPEVSAGLHLSGLLVDVQEGGRLGGESGFLAGGSGGGALWLMQRETWNDG
jgi:hypothetical protein